MKITMTVCDVCKDTDAETTRYEIRSGTRKAAVDLCAAHGQPFEAYLTSGATGTSRGPQKGAQAPARRSRRKKLTTLEEIEASKKS